MERKDVRMEEFRNIIIGFGKAGKTLAAFLAKKGEKTVLVEKDNQMYGGTCINVACIPSKALETAARLSKSIGGDFEKQSLFYINAIQEKKNLTSQLRKKNYEMVVNSGASVIDGEASFIDKNTIQIKKTDGTVENVRGERIFINTGSRPFLPPIPGLKESHFVYTSESLMNLSILPKRLLVLGGGYIGLEFASYYNNFGSEVTVLQDGETFIPKEDREIADEVEASFKERGITLLKGVKTKEVKDLDGLLQVTIEKDGKEETLEAEALLVATGRRPNIEGLHLENAKVEVSDHNNIVTDIHKKTNVDNIFAMGDVTGGFQFTYISLDDFRIVKDYLYGKGERTTENRGAIPYTVFVDPTLSRVGLSEEEAIKKGYDIGVCRLKVNTIPKAKVLKSQVGLLKAIIDKKTDLILGVHLFAVESQEMINLAKLAIDQNIPYTVLRDDIYNHPTMTEAYNDLFKNVQ